MKTSVSLFLFMCITLLSGCTDKKIEFSCEASNTIKPICGIQMPEDLAVLPNGSGILVAEFGEFGAIAGDLGFYSEATGKGLYQKLFTSADLTKVSTNISVWGDPSCKIPNQLSPHGTHLSTRGDDLQYLVVNHANTEQVLFFAVDSSTAIPSLSWRGCVTLEDRAQLNDVVGLADGGFVVTHMYNKMNQTMAQLGSILGLLDGEVWRWHPNTGIKIIANSGASMPNGIELAVDGKSIWVNNYIEQELRQINLLSEEVMASVSLGNIDNSAWLSDGRLLIASHLGTPMEMMACFNILKGSCGAAFELVAVDPTTLEQEVIFKHTGGGVFGPATIAVEYNGFLFAGSFSGDRLARLSISR